MLEPSLQKKKLAGKKLEKKKKSSRSNKALRQENWSWFPWEQRSFGMAKGTLGSGARAKMAWCTGEGQRGLSSLVQASGGCTVCCCLVSFKLCPILLQPHGLQPPRLLCPWNCPGKNTSGLPCPPPGDLPDPEIKSMSPALAGRLFTTGPPGKPLYCLYGILNQ